MSNVRAPKTIGSRVTSPSIELIYEWILTLVRLKTNSLGWKLKVDNSWLARYREKEFTQKHNHYPCSYSFVYFINMQSCV